MQRRLDLLEQSIVENTLAVAKELDDRVKRISEDKRSWRSMD